MVKIPPVIILIMWAARTLAQCGGYPATLHTNKDYCVGSSLVISTQHTLQRIVWYKDGQPIDSALANQSFASTIQNIRLPGVWPTSDLAASDDGNIYFIDGHRLRVVKWNPVTNAITIVGEGLASNSQQTNAILQDRIFVDHNNNVYVADVYNAGVYRFAPGSTKAALIAPRPATHRIAYGQGLYVDCDENIYIGDPQQQTITKWPPGATSGQLIAGASPDHLTAIWQMTVDTLGNAYILAPNQILKWPSGAAHNSVYANFQTPNGALGPYDFWRDGRDTFYLLAWDDVNSQLAHIEKWAAGMASPQLIAPVDAANSGTILPQLTVDPKGNIFVITNADSSVHLYTRNSFIDSTYTPATTGKYYAVVTDMRGYSTTTNPIYITVPTTTVPAISISATATNTPVCSPITFTATPSNPGPATSYQWMVSGVPTGNGSLIYTNNLFADSDRIYCIMTTQAGCAGPINDTSNTIQLNIDPQGAASIKITTPKDSICQGDSALFTAIVANGASTPTFQWLVNGAATNNTSPVFIARNPGNGDIITCIITSDDICGLAKSNSIPLSVSTSPTIENGQVITLLRGQSVTLEPVITGDVDSWQWSPSAGLSDPTLANPIANPDTTTLYTLKVDAPGGCTATGGILVNIYIPLSIANAFTPNGDGHNDRFFVLGGPMGSRVQNFIVFNRFGSEVFHVHNVAPGDPTYSWDGYYKGHLSPAGTYVYTIEMKFADGHTQLYKGTVILIR